MPGFSHTISISAPFARVWALVGDVERVAALFPYCQLTEMEIVAPDSRRFQRIISLPNIAELQWRELATITAPGLMSFRAEEGDLKTYYGSWSLSAAGEQSQLALELTYEVPAALATKMPAVLAGYIMGELFKSICQRIKEAAEAE